MLRTYVVAFLVVVFSLPVSAAGDGAADERAALEAARVALDAAASRLTDLADLYLRERRLDEARQVVDAIAALVDLERRVADRIAAFGAAPPPAPPHVAPPPVAPPPAVPPPPEERQDPIGLALDWLAAHQDEAGNWDADGFMKHDTAAPACDGGGNALYDPGVTGLALLAFLGAGETHKHGRYKETLKAGFKYLKDIQDPEGCFGPRTSSHFTYNTGIATLAMCEAYGMTASPLFKESAQLGVDFILACRNPYLAWRYGVRPGDNDTSVSAWMIMALKSAKAAGLRVDEAAFEGMKAWLEKVTEPEYGRVGYVARGTGPARTQEVMDKFPAEKSEALTAAGIVCRIFAGEDPKTSEIIKKGVELCRKLPPVWDEGSGSIDMYYWYYGTLALFNVGGDAWKEWWPTVRTVAVDHQRKEPASFAGSYDPVDPWGRDGGRVYSTALMTLCLEVTLRYPRIFPGK